eukprot:31494-Pelagococcus_subviridis.AAC.34
MRGTSPQISRSIGAVRTRRRRGVALEKKNLVLLFFFPSEKTLLAPPPSFTTSTASPHDGEHGEETRREPAHRTAARGVVRGERRARREAPRRVLRPGHARRVGRESVQVQGAVDVRRVRARMAREDERPHEARQADGVSEVRGQSASLGDVQLPRVVRGERRARREASRGIRRPLLAVDGVHERVEAQGALEVRDVRARVERDGVQSHEGKEPDRVPGVQPRAGKAESRRRVERRQTDGARADCARRKKPLVQSISTKKKVRQPITYPSSFLTATRTPPRSPSRPPAAP